MLAFPSFECPYCGAGLTLTEDRPEIVGYCPLGCSARLAEAFALGLWILANAAAAQQIVSRALFHQLSIDLAEDRRCDWELVGAISGRRVELLEGIDVAGKRPLAARVPGPGAAYSAKRSPRATPPGTQPRPSKKRRKKR